MWPPLVQGYVVAQASSEETSELAAKWLMWINNQEPNNSNEMVSWAHRHRWLTVMLNWIRLLIKKIVIYIINIFGYHLLILIFFCQNFNLR